MDATAQDLIARLRRNPEDSEAFAALRAHYQRVGDYASLANLLEGWAGRTRDTAAGAQAMFEAGELVLGALADRERAVRMYERALSIDARHQDAFLRLRGMFEDAGETRRQAELLERHAGRLSKAGADPRDVAVLYHQLGEIWEHRFARVDKAVHQYRKAFELDPGLVAALYAAREIYRNAGNLKAAATILEKEAKVELDPTRKVALWRELAHTRAEDLGDQEGAARALKHALAEAPGDLEVMNDLARVYLTRSETIDDPHVAASDRHRASDLLYQMAQQVPAEHAVVYLEQALDARPDNDGALAMFERMMEDAGQLHRLPGRWVAYLAHAPDRPESNPRRKRLADAYLESGQVDYAIMCLEWLLEEGDPEAAERLVDLYRQQGREPDAVRALGIAARGLPPDKRLPRLRELIAALRDRGEINRAVDYAHEVLAVEPSDPEALHLIEDACRQSGDHEPLRVALLNASRVAGLPTEQRKQRLKQVAQLSERQLEDTAGAISAWRGVTALDPADSEARTALKRLLTEAQLWDELVDVLEREALSLTDPDQKAEVYRQLATIHREHRSDLEAAIGALRNLRDLVPGDLEGRDALCDALIDAGADLEAIPMLRTRIDEADGDARIELLRTLATILGERVGDAEGAFEAWARLLEERPSDLDALAHMQAIDESGERPERLLSTLSYKVEIIEAEAQPPVLIRMASIADRELRDLERAAELYGRALELTPSDPALLDALCDVYDRSERFRDLVVLLRATAQDEKDPANRAELYRRIARTLAQKVGNDDGAAEAYREVLQVSDDEEALRFLVRHTTRTDDVEALDGYLKRLIERVEAPSEKRDLSLDRAALLADRLDKPAEAIAVFRYVVDELQPDHVGALQRIAELSEAGGDTAGLTEALWRQLGFMEDPGLRVPVARRLADLHEGDARDDARAIEALQLWSDADLTDPVPFERLLPLLESEGRFEELVGALDSLSGLSEEPEEGSRLNRRAAEIAYRQLGDIDGAWARLAPSAAEGDGAAEADLRTLAESANRGAQLAEMYVGLAQNAPEADVVRARWMDAADVYENVLGGLNEALEAVLRAFAVDLGEHEYLDAADRLAERAAQWERLGQVYETLIRRADTPEEKVQLLLRHAALLDERANETSAALDQTLRACSLDPLDDDILALAEERAPRANRADELLITYDKRKSSAEDDDGRVEALLRSAKLCEQTLHDRNQAVNYLAMAIALTVRSPELTERVEALATLIDETPGAVEPDAPGVRRAVVDVYRALADDMEEDPVGGARLLLRAARVLEEELAVPDEAFETLKQAASYAPAEDEVLDRLEALAKRRDALDALDAHLAELIDEALDSRTASGLLRRRGTLLEDDLQRYDDAAEVWRRLSSVTGGDAEATARLTECLRKAGRYQDILVVLQRDLRRASEPENEIALQKAIARVWEQDIGNVFEAVDAWKKVLDSDEDDVDAAEAIARLEEARKRRSERPLEEHVPSPGAQPIAQPITDDAIEPPDAIAEAGPQTDDSIDAPQRFDEAILDETTSRERAQDLEAADSSETILDDGLQAELLAELAKAQPSEVASETSGGAESEARGPTRQLDPDSIAAPAVQDDPVALVEDDDAPPMPGGPMEFDDHDYTALSDGENVFAQLQQQYGTPETPEADEPAEAVSSELELVTGEIELLEADLEDEFEELDDLDDLEAIEETPRTSVPPPLPPKK